VGKDHGMPAILGIEVQPAQLEAWQGWLAPDPQPFLVGCPGEWDCEDEGGVLTRELADTYRLWWGVEKPSAVVWVSAQQFAALPRSVRAALVREQARRRRGATPSVRAWQDVLDRAQLRAQADGHRFVWWPSLLMGRADDVLARVVSDGRLPSRHADVPAHIWRAADGALPGARRLGGTFPAGSTMNCFTTVMEAAGASSRAALDDVAPFDEWLDTACRRGGDPSQAGVVLVWRRPDGSPVHAAVTLGGGWALEKPSRDWHSPHAVLTVAEVMKMSRHPGERVERWTIA
jgi:hypothetical protein